MHQYRYEAAGKDGEIIRGVITAPDLSTARDDVEARLMLPLKLLEVPEERTPRRKPVRLAWR